MKGEQVKPINRMDAEQVGSSTKQNPEESCSGTRIDREQGESATRMESEQGGSGGATCGSSKRKIDLVSDTQKGPSGEIKTPRTVPSQSLLDRPFQLIQAVSLKIGDWERTKTHENNLLATFFYEEKKLRWEISEIPCDKKIEFPCSDIVAIKATFGIDGKDCLEIELSQAPSLFYRIMNDGTWKPTMDFPDDPMSTSRMHCLEFPEGKLKKPFNMLIFSDQRLHELIITDFPMHQFLDFGNQQSTGTTSQLAGSSSSGDTNDKPVNDGHVPILDNQEIPAHNWSSHPIPPDLQPKYQSIKDSMLFDSPDNETEQAVSNHTMNSLNDQQMPLPSLQQGSTLEGANSVATSSDSKTEVDVQFWRQFGGIGDSNSNPTL